MSYLLQRNQPLAQPPTVSSQHGVLATTITLGFVSASLSCGPNCVSPPFTLHTPKTPQAAPASSARRLIVAFGLIAGAVLCLWRRRPRTVVGQYRPVSKENLAELAENIRA